MLARMAYFKSTIVIYSEFDPESVELDYLVRHAVDGDAICTEQRAQAVSPQELPDEAASFFGID